MMGDIVRLDSDRHGEIKALLPWYVTGRLEPAEHARVAAHVAGCSECQNEVRFERRLGLEVAEAPVEVEQGWMDMRRRVAAGRPGALAALRRAGPWLGAVVAAQAVVLIVLGGWLVPRLAPPPYHALASAAAPAAGNVVVMFRPQTSERSVRLTLAAAGARMADGPTGAGAWVLRVASVDRAKALAILRARPEVTLAQPVDPAAAP
jgi:predicted NBD/HSP70 family sugar kinase